MAQRTGLAILLVVGRCLVPTSGACAGIAGSKHDLSTSGGGEIRSTNITISCYFCHSVHTPEEGSGSFNAYPMWNRNLDSLGPYAVYASDTLDSTPDAVPSPVSLACLSCHDGTVAVNVTRTGTLGTMTPTDILTGRPSDLTTDLSKDHPVSFAYDSQRDSALKTAEEVTNSGLILYGESNDRLECGSCHNPHDPTHEPFLRISNERSALCNGCHLK